MEVLLSDLEKDFTIIIPGNGGRDCPYNGNNNNEIRCDECDYLLCCIDSSYPQSCSVCKDNLCVRKNSQKG